MAGEYFLYPKAYLVRVEGEGTSGSYLLPHEAIMISNVTERLLTLYVVDLDGLLVSTEERRGTGEE